MIIYILTILIFTITLFPKIRNNHRLRSVRKKLNDFKFINSFLLFWIFLGFFTRFDFTQMIGDIIGGESILDYNNIGFFTISFVLIFTTRFSINKKSKTILVLIELIIWSIRYFYLKGGYAMGFAADYPWELIVFYDVICITLRIKLINNINYFKFFNQLKTYIIVVLFVSIKIFLLPYPHDLFWEVKWINVKIEKRKTLLIGNWEGRVKYDSIWVDTIKTYQLDTISDNISNIFNFEANRTLTDSTHKYFLKDMQKPISKLASIKINDDMIITTEKINCNMDFIHWDWGSLFLNDSTEYGHFEILKINKDSLEIMVTEGYNKDYNYKLKRK